MNNDSEQFGIEHLKEMLDEDINPLDGFSSVPNYWLHHFARIALAAKQAKHVGYLFVAPDGGIAYSISNVEFEGVQLVGAVYDGPAVVDVAPDINKLRELVDVVWREAKESTEVPSTKWADEMISKVYKGL